jgi:hypothetical protein
MKSVKMYTQNYDVQGKNRVLWSTKAEGSNENGQYYTITRNYYESVHIHV